MPVKKEELAAYVSELGLPSEVSEGLISTLMGNEPAAVQFIGQRMRHDDYTKKTQGLATHKQQIEANANQQITEYAQRLSDADTRINKIMTDMENATISAATANARLHKVKETYNLSDDDIPAVPVAKPAGTGSVDGLDIDKKLADFRGAIIKDVMGEMMAMPQIYAIQSDISANHQELTGKRLSKTDMNALLDTAQKKKIPLERAWEETYNIPDLRMTKHNEALKITHRQEWEAEQKRINSDAAMSAVRPGVDSTPSHSPVIGRKFAPQGTEPVSDPARSAPVADKSPAPPAARMSGAERAAARFIERRQSGIRMGAPDPVTA